MDILDEMTKDEIIWWLRDQPFFIVTPPRKSDILFYRWQKKTNESQEKHAANNAFGRSIDMAKRDAYARQFNASSDIEEKLLIAEKMAPIEVQWSKHISDYKQLRIEDEKIDRLYDQIDVERQKETTAITNNSFHVRQQLPPQAEAGIEPEGNS